MGSGRGGAYSMLQKLEQYIFYFFLFAIPFQTRKILYYPGWLFSEWQAVSLYLTDIILMMLLIFWWFSFSSHGGKFLISKSEILNKFKISKSKLRNPDFYLLLFVVISAISIKNSSAFYLSFYSLLKLIEFVIFYFYIKTYALNRFDRLHSLLALIFGGLFQSAIAIVQFFRQQDFGLWFLGESTLNTDIRGIASFLSSSGEKIIRAYGTTPHPNVLAGYLLLSIFAFYTVYGGFKKKFTSLIFHIPASAIYGVILFGFFFTFSRAVIAVWGILFIVSMAFTFKYKKEYAKRAGEILIMTMIFSALFLLA